MNKKILLGAATLSILLASGIAYYHFSKPTVSVIMSTYNRAHLLPRSIKSILNQTYKDFEFIIVDDGSTDHTERILLGYAKQDGRIKLIKNEKNEGLIASRNKSLKMAKGKYIAIMDSDDQAFPNRLEKSLKVFEENKDVQAVSGATYDIENDLSPEVFLSWDDYHKINNDFSISLMFKNTFPNPAAMFRADFIKNHNITYNKEYEAAEDYDFWKQIVFNGGKIITIYEPLTLIRRHITNKPEYYEKMDETSKKIHKEFISRFYEPEESEIMSYYPPMAKCNILQKIIGINKTKNVVSQEEVERFYLQNCPANVKEAYYVKHPAWEDYISKEGDKYFRQSTKEKVQIEEKGNLLIVQFENQPATKFKLNPETEKYHLYGDNPIVLKHSQWEDEMYQPNPIKKDYYCRFLVQDCGKISRKENGQIFVKWNNPSYPIEKFKLDKKTKKYIQE